jgi:hypothetical protein
MSLVLLSLRQAVQHVAKGTLTQVHYDPQKAMIVPLA